MYTGFAWDRPSFTFTAPISIVQKKEGSIYHVLIIAICVEYTVKLMNGYISIAESQNVVKELIGAQINLHTF